jgi:hypothetical protein
MRERPHRAVTVRTMGTLIAALVMAGGVSSAEAPSSAPRAAQADPACTNQVTFGVVEAVSECFRREGEMYVSTAPVRVNGITFNPIAGRPLRFNPTRRTLSLGRIQLRLGSIVLYEGELSWRVPDGDRVTLARIDLGTHSLADQLPSDTEAALDLVGDDAANVQGFELKGEATLELAPGRTILSGSVELPGAFTDAEGNGLTGKVQLTADNERGVHVSGIDIRVPRAFVGRLELQNLFVTFAGEANADASATCNAESPGLRWEGGADAVVVPTPEPLRLQDVGLGFADGRFNYARASWVPPPPGKDIGNGVRIQRVAVSLCAGPPVRLEGRVGLTALPREDGTPGLEIPDAGLIFEGGDPWSLRAEAPSAVLNQGGRQYRFSELSVEYRSSGSVDFGGQLDFSLPVSGPTPVGTLDAGVRVQARARGFIDGARFNAELQARGCFAGSLRIGDAVPISIGEDDLCAQVDGVVSSVGLAVCGQVELRDRLFALGAGYRWGGTVDLITGACDLSPWQTARVARAAGLSRSSSWSVPLPDSRRGVVLGVRGRGARGLTIRGPNGERLRTSTDPRRAVRAGWGLAFANEAADTTFVLLAAPAGGRWTVTPGPRGRIRDVRVAEVLPAPRVHGHVRGDARAKELRYAIRPRRGQRVVFQERGRGASKILGAVRGGGRGRLRFRPADGPGGRRNIVAVVEQRGLPRRRLTVASYVAPPQARPGAPARLRLRRAGRVLHAAWAPARHTSRYGIRVALPDGRRLLFLRDRGRRSLRLGGVPRRGEVRVRVVGLRSDNAAGPAATGSIGTER